MNKQTILIVDDDEIFAQILLRSFQRQGYEGAYALNLTDAECYLKDLLPDFAVVDLKIDQESGLQFLPVIRDYSPHTRTLILTGYSSITTTVEAMKLGCVNYLCKPVNTAEIIQALKLDAANPDLRLPEQPTSVNRLEWEHIQRVLRQHEGNISATAKALGMHRRTLQRKLQKRPVSK